MSINPGEFYKEGDPLIFASERARDIFYNPPDRRGCPLVFDSLEAEDRFYHPEIYCVDNSLLKRETDVEPALPTDLQVQQKPTEVEVLPMHQLSGHPPSPIHNAIQVNGGIHFHQDRARTDTGGQDESPPASEPQQHRTPKPMDMADKLMRMERFASFERGLYMYERSKGIHSLIDRDDTKGIIIDRLAEDLRIRGTANQVHDVYEFLRLDKRLEVVQGPPKHLLAFTNGILNLRTGEFTPKHSPDVFLTWRLEIPYMPGEKNCPRFNAVLQHISGGDPVFIARVLEIIGYLLVPSTFIKGIILFQGLSGTGKSLIARLISSFFDSGIVSHVPAQRFENRFSAATLQGRKLNSSMDLPGGRIGAEAVSILKEITGGDDIYVESKGVDGHSAHLDCRFLFGTNHRFLPAVQDEAFMNRIILLPFRFPVSPETDDPDLDKKLLVERSAIFNLVLEAFYHLQRNHFQFTGEDIYGIRVAGLGNSEADPMITAFIRECCTMEPSGYVPTAVLFEAYSAFLTERGYPPAGNVQQFSRIFNEATPSSVDIKKIRVGGKPTNCYIGITLKGENYAEK